VQRSAADGGAVAAASVRVRVLVLLAEMTDGDDGAWRCVVTVRSVRVS
jgi:hypothetical protein